MLPANPGGRVEIVWRAANCPCAGIVVKQHDRRAFFLNRVEPTTVGVEMEMPRSVSWWQRDCGRFIRSQHALLLVELPDEDLIQAQVDMQHEASRGIGLNHVRVSPIMSAEGKAARRSIGRLGRANLPDIVLDVRGVAQTTVGQNRQHRHGAAKVVGHQQELSGRMDAHIGRTGAAGANRVEQLQLPVRRTDCEGADRAFLVVTHPIRFIGGIQSGSRGIHSQAAGARAHLVDADGRHCPGGAIHLEQVYAATIAGRQIHLRWQHIAERRTERADIGNQWPTGFVRLSLEQTGEERSCSHQRDEGS